MKCGKLVLLGAIAAVLVGLCACTNTADTDATGSTAIKETENGSFELFHETDHVYRYVGKDRAVTLEDYGLTVNLPEEWVGRVEILHSSTPGHLELYLANTKLMEAYAEYEGKKMNQTYAWHDFILFVSSVPKEDKEIVEECDNDQYKTFLGENEQYRFYYTIASRQNTDCNTFLTEQYTFIRDKGQEYYDSLVGDLVCTDELAKEILKVS